MPPDAALEIRGISKSYGPTRVLSDIGFVIGRGRIHALVGENGAGKSTLVKIITGIVEADAGEVLLDGTARPLRDADRGAQGRHRRRLSGPQALRPSRRRREHLIWAPIRGPLSARSTGAPCIERRRAPRSRRLGIAIDPHALVAGLSIAEAQFVEIARALSTDVRVLILDEPTSALTPAEAERLFAHRPPAARRGQVDRLHHPSAGGGRGGCRRHHRPARRATCRDPAGARDRQGRARPDDGRPLDGDPVRRSEAGAQVGDGGAPRRGPRPRGLFRRHLLCRPGRRDRRHGGPRRRRTLRDRAGPVRHDAARSRDASR